MKFKIFFVRKGRNNGSSFESIVRFNPTQCQNQITCTRDRVTRKIPSNCKIHYNFKTYKTKVHRPEDWVPVSSR